MGNSASADIIYGMASQDRELIPCDDTTYEYLFDHYEWQEEFYRRKGLEYPGWSVELPDEIKQAGCMMDIHGYTDDPGLFLGIIDSHINTSWDFIERLDTAKLNPTTETLQRWREQLESFCQLMGIPFQEPGWLLLCSYG